MCGNSAYDWNTMLTSRSLAARSVTSLPPISTRPLVTASSPATMRSVVVLPQPEGPSSVTSSPCATLNETSSTAVTLPYLLVTRSKTTPPSLVHVSAHCGAVSVPPGLPGD